VRAIGDIIKHMTKAHSHMLQREYGAEEAAKPLMLWLDSALRAKAKRSYERVSECLRLLAELQKLSSDYIPAYRDLSLSNQPKFLSIWRAAQTANDQLNSILSFYRFELQIGEVRLGAGRWFVRWKSVGKKTFTTALSDERIPFKMPFTEADAIMRCIQLSEAGYLARVRECANCKKWHYARFSHMRFCSLQCQQANFRSSPEFKAHRRQYLRKHRALKASGKVK
jgi:hypothetical protein